MAVLNGKVTFCGGLGTNTKKCWKYEIPTNEWIEITTSIYQHIKRPSIALNNKLYYLNNNGESEIFDPVTNTWTPWKSPPKESGSRPCLIAWKDSVIVIGGELHLRGVQLYNVTTDSWRTLNAITVGDFYAHSCVRMPKGSDKFLVVGGNSFYYNAADIYDASTDSWKQIAETIKVRRFSNLVTLGKRIFAMGGHDLGGVMSDTVEEYLIDKNVWELKNIRLPLGRGNSAALAVPANWFATKNLEKPLANGCQGIF